MTFSREPPSARKHRPAITDRTSRQYVHVNDIDASVDESAGIVIHVKGGSRTAVELSAWLGAIYVLRFSLLPTLDVDNLPLNHVFKFWDTVQSRIFPVCAEYQSVTETVLAP